MSKYLWMATAVFIVYGTSLPFRFVPDPEFALDKLARVPLDVFTPTDPRRGLSFPDMVQNLLLFVPFGAFGVLALRRRLGTLVSMALVTCLGLALSLFVESLQLFTIDRSSSMNDVAMNTAGTVAGALLAPAAATGTQQLIAIFRVYGVGRTVDSLYPLLVAAMLLALAAWHPFDVALNLGGMWSDVRRFVADPLQMGVFADEGADALRHGLFGAAAVAWLRASGHRRAVLAGALAATAAACVLEGSQVFLMSRVPGLKDVFVGAAGGWVGALAAGSGMRFWPRWRLGLLVILLAWIAAAFIMLTPFDWAETRRPFGTLPFDSYYRRASGATVSHVVELVLAFFPIGFAVARVVPRWRMPAAVAAGLVLVWPLEYLQGWTASRVPDVTGPLVGVLGASLGGWMGGPIRHRFTREVSRPAHDCPPKRTPDPITEL